MKPKAVVLMFHRFVEKYEDINSPMHNNEVSLDFLEKTIIDLLNADCYFITMDYLHSLISSKEIRKDNRKYVVITVDDGYKDLLHHALPIFEKYHVPFTLYLSNSFYKNEGIMWWYDLEKYIKEKHSNFNKEGLIEFRRHSKSILKSGNNHSHKLESITKNKYRNSNYEEVTLSLEDLYSLQRNELCSIGIHTSNHFSLRYLKKDDLYKEIYNSIIDFDNKSLNYTCHFAYPYGTVYSVGLRELLMTKNIFLTSVTTQEGFIYSFFNNLHLLPRINVIESDKFNRIMIKFKNSMDKEKIT